MKKLLRRLATVTMALVLAGTPLHSSSVFAGEMYVTGGGVGEVSCSSFVNDMATARQVGFDTNRGFAEMAPWWQHTLGFITGYNMAEPKIRDLAASARGHSMESMRVTLLTMADIHCKTNLTSSFNSALKSIRDQLLPTATWN
jgi:hypothetical protein